MIRAARGDGILVDADGAPVWPLGCPADCAAVAAICESFGQEVAWVASRNGVPRQGDDIVVALGAESRAAAALYAHLTARTVLYAATAEDVVHDARIKAIISLTRDVDDELIERLFGETRDFYPGLIVAASADALRRRVLVAAAALSASRLELPHRLELFPSFALEAMTSETHSLFGRKAAATLVRSALGRGASAVLIHGHGDGIDGDLGPLVLCPADEAWMHRPAGEDAPVCRNTGRCYRNRSAIGSPEHRAVRLDVREIRARVVIWSTCIGFPSPRGFIGRDWGAGVRLAESDRIGALLTSWRITLAPAARSVALLDRLMAGDSLGEALGWYNSTGAGQQLCLFGDPDLRIAPRAPRTQHQPIQAALRRKPAAMRLASADPATRLIELCLSKANAAHMTPRQAQRQQSLLNLARRALDASRTSRRAERILRHAAVALAASRGSLRDIWIPHVASFIADGATPCPHCEGHAERLLGDLAHLGIAPRMLINCSRCEIAADRPLDWRVSAKITHERIEMHGDLEAGRCFGLVSCASRWPIAPRYRRWPSDAQGRPAQALSLADWDWPYPCEVSVIIASGLELAVLARTLPARRRDARPAP